MSVAVFTFKLSDLSAGLTRSNQWKWWGPCKAEIEGTLLRRLTAELKVEHISESDLRSRHVASRFDIKHPAVLELEQNLSTAQTEGTADAMILARYEETTASLAERECLGITIGLRPQKYELFRTFLTSHFGNANVVGHISFTFLGFPPASEGGLILPSEAEFMNGRSYVVIDDATVTFSAGPVKR